MADKAITNRVHNRNAAGLPDASTASAKRRRENAATLRSGSVARSHWAPRRRGNTDTVKLLMLGYRQELAREFTTFNCYGANLNVLSSFATLAGPYGIGIGFTYGGPVVMTWGWMAVLLLNLSVGLSLAEMASAYPTSGALYYWSYRLAPRRIRNLTCFLTAWVLMLGQAALSACGAFTFLELITAVIEHQYGITLSPFRKLGILVAVLVVTLVLNCGSARLTAFLTTMGAFWHMIALVGFCLALLLLAPKTQSAEYIFTKWQSDSAGTGISSPVYTALLGILMAQWTFTGFDGAAHLAEETVGAEVAVPTAMLLSILGAGLCGFLLIITLVLVKVDDSIVFDPKSNMVLEILAQVLDQGRSSLRSSTALFAIPLVASAFCSLQVLANTSRVLYAFARDQGVPLWRLAAYVHPRSKAPAGAALYMVTVAGLLSAPMCFNANMFSVVTSFAVLACYVGFFIPVLCKLTTGRRHFLPGPFQLRPRLSTANNVLSALWMGTVVVLCALPAALPVTPQNCNWSGPMLIWVVVMLLAWYFFPKYGARTWFQGPRPNLGQFQDVLPSDLAREQREGDDRDARRDQDQAGRPQQRVCGEQHQAETGEAAATTSAKAARAAAASVAPEGVPAAAGIAVGRAPGGNAEELERRGSQAELRAGHSRGSSSGNIRGRSSGGCGGGATAQGRSSHRQSLSGTVAAAVSSLAAAACHKLHLCSSDTSRDVAESRAPCPAAAASAAFATSAAAAVAAAVDGSCCVGGGGGNGGEEYAALAPVSEARSSISATGGGGDGSGLHVRGSTASGAALPGRLRRRITEVPVHGLHGGADGGGGDAGACSSNEGVITNADDSSACRTTYPDENDLLLEHGPRPRTLLNGQHMGPMRSQDLRPTAVRSILDTAAEGASSGLSSVGGSTLRCLRQLMQHGGSSAAAAHAAAAAGRYDGRRSSPLADVRAVRERLAGFRSSGAGGSGGRLARRLSISSPVAPAAAGHHIFATPGASLLGLMKTEPLQEGSDDEHDSNTAGQHPAAPALCATSASLPGLHRYVNPQPRPRLMSAPRWRDADWEASGLPLLALAHHQRRRSGIGGGMGGGGAGDSGDGYASGPCALATAADVRLLAERRAATASAAPFSSATGGSAQYGSTEECLSARRTASRRQGSSVSVVTLLPPAAGKDGCTATVGSGSVGFGTASLALLAANTSASVALGQAALNTTVEGLPL